MAWLSGWSKRVKLTIDKDDIDAPLTDFPILVYISASSGRDSDDISFVFDELQNDANRKKIAVTLANGTTECYVEIEKWDDASEEAWLWVKVSGVDSIASGADTDLYLYYDADHAENTNYVGDTNSTPAENVWDANFEAVYHGADGVDNQHIYDSTGNNRDGTKSAAGFPTEVTGDIGKEQDFNGIDEFIGFGNILNKAYNAQQTIEAYIKTDGAGSRAIVSKQDWGSPYRGYNFYFSVGRIFYVYYYHSTNRVQVLTDATYNDGTRRYVAFTKASQAASDIIFYVDGEVVGSAVYSGRDTSTTTASPIVPLEIGARDSMGYFFEDLIDEVRLSDTARSAAWIKATKESLYDDLLGFGSEEETMVGAFYLKSNALGINIIKAGGI